MSAPLIIDIDKQIADAEYQMKLGIPFDSAFPFVKRDGVGSQFVGPTRALLHAINWIWLNQHKGIPAPPVLASARTVAVRSLETYRMVAGQMYREQHDALLLGLAILINDSKLLECVLDLVRHADDRGGKSPFYEACSGMLKFWITGHSDMMDQQFKLFATCRGKEPILRMPKKAFYEAFVHRNSKPLQRQCQTVAEEFWRRLEKARQPHQVNRAGTIELGVWDYNRFWPWPETVMLKLMAKEGHQFKVDGFWFPAGFLSHLNK